MRKSSLLLALLLLATTFTQAQISRTEKKILSAIEAKGPQALALLQESLNLNSGTMNFEGVKQVGMLYKKEFEALGMECAWLDGSSFNRAGHIVARQQGGKGPVLLLIGHLDTVFEPDSPFQEYKMLNDSIMQGPGVADMKGGNAIILLALRGLKEAGLLDKMNIEVVLTGDEENSGTPLERSKQALVEAAQRADIALGFENADGKPETIVVSRRGSSGWELKVKGNAGHSSQIFSERVGVGAIYEASRILNEFYTSLSGMENLTFNPGLILGGTRLSLDAEQNSGTAAGKSNVVAREVVVQGDLRAVSPEQLEEARARMQEIVARNYPGTSAEISFLPGGYPPMAATEANRKLLAHYDQLSRELGYGAVTAVHPRNAGAADVSFTAPHVAMAIDGLGLSGADDHSVRETGNIHMLPVQAKRAAILMYRLAYDKL